MMRKVFLHVLAAAMLAACSEGNGTETTPAPTSTPTPTPTPYDSSLDTTVEGRDDDGNGIRDDVDSFIIDHYTGYEATVYMNVARNIQAAIIDASDLDVASQTSDDEFLLSECIRNNSTSSAADYDELVALILNTDARRDAYTSRFETLRDYQPELITEQDVDDFCKNLM